MQSGVCEPKCLCKTCTASHMQKTAAVLQTDQAYYTSFSRPAFIKVASERNSLSTFYHLLNVIWTLQPIRLSAWQSLVSLHMSGYHVVSPKYTAALSLRQKHPAPENFLDYMYAHFCSPKCHLALHVSSHVAQMIFKLICLSQGDICSKGIARQLTIC